LYSTPSGETLDSLIVWLPAERTAFIGNLFGAIQGALPNFYTARGDRDRSVARFFVDIELLLNLRPSVLITGHDDPITGEQKVTAYLTKLRDMVRHLHDETIKGMSEHKELWHLMQTIQLPEHLQPAPGRSPTPWYIRTIWEEYTGWFRGELTSELYATPAKAIWPELAQLAGGTEKLVAAAEQKLQEGNPEAALHFIEIAISADPDCTQVRETELKILAALIDANAGKHFDELGWLEHNIRATEQKLAEQNPA
jgi:alkyl sulfatase BDS1-like metallo-beta-lactamase superfamily hydrolase